MLSEFLIQKLTKFKCRKGELWEEQSFLTEHQNQQGNVRQGLSDSLEPSKRA